jgi:hypothetical protein
VLAQSLKALLGRGVAEGVEAIHFKGCGNGLNISARSGHLGLIRAVHKLRHDNGTEHTNDDYHNHDFNQGEARCLGLKHCS